MTDTSIEPYASVVISLLKGVVFHDETDWNKLIDYQVPIRSYLSKIGLKLLLDENGGYAYLEQFGEDDDPLAATLPRLTRRRPLNYRVTLLCVLLRERLDQHEAQMLDQGPLFVTTDDVTEMIRLFLPESLNEKQVNAQIQATINEMLEMKFLRESKTYSGRYEVRPILRAKVNSERLAEIKEKLLLYHGNEYDDV